MRNDGYDDGSGMAPMDAPMAPAAPSVPSYRTPQQLTPIRANAGFNNTEDPIQAAKNDRQRINAGGDVLDQDIRDWTNSEQGRSNNYEDRVGSRYSDILNGGGGYTPEQRDSIMREAETSGLRLSDQDLSSRQLSEGERGAIAGDPDRALSLFSPNADWTREVNSTGNASVRNAVGGLESGLGDATNEARTNYRGAIDPASLNLSEGFSSGIGREIGDSRKDFALSDRYSQNRGWTPEEIQGIQDQAARSVGAQYGQASNELERRAEASGTTNPMAVAAAKRRLLIDRGADAGDAYSNAAIAALDKQKNAEQNIEDTRLGAAGTGAGLRLGALSDAERIRMGGQGTLQQGRLQAATGIANTASQNAATAGQERVRSEEGIRTGDRDINMWAGNQVATLGGQGEQRQSDRAGQLATNRQNVTIGGQNDRFNQGFQVAGALSGRATTVANQDQGQKAEARGWEAGQQNQANQNVNQGWGNRLQNTAQTNQAGNQATQNLNQANSARTAGRQGWAGIALGGAQTGAKVAGFEFGGVVTEPTLALVGENGPERITPVGGSVDLEKWSRGGRGGWSGFGAPPAAPAGSGGPGMDQGIDSISLPNSPQQKRRSPFLAGYPGSASSLPPLTAGASA